MKHRQKKLLQSRALQGHKYLSPPARLSRLARAASQGNLDYARRTLQAGADPNQGSGCNGTLPLVEAAGSGDTAMARLLLEHGASSNAAAADGVTPLITAAYEGHIETVRLLLSRGADAALRDETGATALDWAQSCGREEVSLVLSRHEDKKKWRA